MGHEIRSCHEPISISWFMSAKGFVAVAHLGLNYDSATGKSSCFNFLEIEKSPCSKGPFSICHVSLHRYTNKNDLNLPKHICSWKPKVQKTMEGWSMTFVCLRLRSFFYGFYHGKSQLNHHLGTMFCHFSKHRFQATLKFTGGHLTWIKTKS